MELSGDVKYTVNTKDPRDSRVLGSVAQDFPGKRYSGPAGMHEPFMDMLSDPRLVVLLVSLSFESPPCAS